MRLIYLSSVPWRGLSQRSHEHVRYFHSSSGGEVLWIDPYPTRLPRPEDLFRRRPSLENHERAATPPWLTVVKPKVPPVEPLPLPVSLYRPFWRPALEAIDRFRDETTVVGFGKPSKLALEVLDRWHFNASFYDAMDDVAEFYSGYSRLAMARLERFLVPRVGTVITSSPVLAERFHNDNRDIRLVMNACAAERMPPPRAAMPSRQRPRIGFVGAIARWFDWDLALAMAADCPGHDFVLAGPLFGARPALPGNVTLLPALPQEDAFREMLAFDVGLIPFVRSRLTASVDPIKYYEYRALGVPVVSTSFGSMTGRGTADGVFLVTEPHRLKQVIDAALAHRDVPDAIATFRAANSWHVRFADARLFGE